MVDWEQVPKIKDLLENANNVLVVIDSQASYDFVAAGCSLYLGLAQAGKQAVILSPQAFNQPPWTQLVGSDHITAQIGHQNLVVSFDYQEEAVDKVSYHIGEESGKFYLTIKPKKGVQPLDSKSVEFAYTGIDADLIFLIGVNKLEALDTIYFGHEAVYQDTPIVNIHKFKPEFGNINLDVSDHASLCEVMVGVIEQLGLGINADMATNLLAGIENSTQQFSSFNVTADTFQLAANLLKLGARRFKPIQSAKKNKVVIAKK